MGAGWGDDTVEPGDAVQGPPPRNPPHGMDRPHPRRTPRVHPPEVRRPRPDTPPQSPPPPRRPTTLTDRYRAKPRRQPYRRTRRSAGRAARGRRNLILVGAWTLLAQEIL